MGAIQERVFDLELRRVYFLAGLAAERKVHGANPEVIDRLEGRLGAILDDLSVAREQMPGELPDERLAKRLNLNRFELEYLWTSCALSTDLGTLPHAIALIGSDARKGPTLLLHAVICDLRGRQARELTMSLRSSHPLIKYGLLEPLADEVVLAACPMPTPIRVAAYLQGKDIVDSRVQEVGGLVELPEALTHDEGQTQSLDRIKQIVGANRPLVSLITGPFGSGRKTAVAAAAASFGKKAVYIDARRAGLKVDELRKNLRALRRECLLRNAVPIVGDVDEIPSDDKDGGLLLRELADFAMTAEETVFFTTKHASLEMPVNTRIIRTSWPVPDSSTRRTLWDQALHHVQHNLDEEALVTASMGYKMGAGGIADAVSAAVMVTESEKKEKMGVDELTEGVRSSVADRLGGLATRVDTKQSWEDLVLAPDTLTQVKSVISRIRHAHQVYVDWGFHSKVAKGIGVSILFSGPPGTGKTMVAGLIAKELGLELYQVDLSKVTSKWVGETEKNLGKIFDATEAGHALLLFDEADSLFAKRTEVKGANDRYANLEVNYLLQRIESFGGVTVLTTNLETSIDDALKRRLSGHVVFWRPEIEERIELWKRQIPADAPIDGDIDFEKLAERYSNMSGAHIRNSVLSAAFIAAHEGSVLSHELLERAAKAQYRTMGHVL